MKPETAHAREQPLYLPNFCTSQASLAVVTIVELTAILLTLARSSATLDFWTDLAYTSLFLLWIGLTGAGLLCVTSPYLKRMRLVRGSVAVLAMVIFVVAAVSALACLLGRSPMAGAAGLLGVFPPRPGAFILSNIAIAFVVTAIALRYFYVTHQWRHNVEMQARARVYALQARIRPHFLFNSMNTIASLTRSNPAQAEQAVQDLADLFRASLSERSNTLTLAEEIEVARTYQRIEQLRLGSRLQVLWQIDELPMRALVPGLLLQPLLENAIYYGVEPQPEGGTVTVSGELAGGLVTIVVRNRVADRDSEREGNKLALANIRERLTLLYGDRALVKTGQFDSEYIVTLRFPHVENRSRMPA